MTDIAGAKIGLGVDDKGVTAGLDKAAAAFAKWQKTVQATVNNINADRPSLELRKIEAALQQMGGVAKLSETQLANLQKRVESLAAAGGKLPDALKGLKLTAPSLDASALIANLGQQLQGIGSQLSSNLGGAGGALGALGPGGLAAAAGLGALAAAATAVGVAIKDSVGDVVAYGSHIQDLADKSHLGTDLIQELAYSAKQVGGDETAAADAAFKLQKAIGEGNPALERLGFNLATLRGQDTSTSLQQVVGAVLSLRTENEQAAAGAAIFEKSWLGARATFEEFSRGGREAAHQFGAVLTADVIANADKAGDNLAKMGAAIESIKLQFGAAFLSGGDVAAVILGIAAAAAKLGEAVREAAPQIKQLAIALVAISAGPDVAQALADTLATLKEMGKEAEAQAEARKFLAGLNAPAKAPGVYLPPDVLANLKKLKEDAEKLSREAQKASHEAAQKSLDAWMKAARESDKAWEKFYDDMNQRGRQAAAELEKDVLKRMQPGRDLAMATGSADMQTAAFKAAGGLRELDMVVDESKGYWTKYQDVVDQELENAGSGVTKFAKTVAEKMADVASALSEISSSFSTLGAMLSNIGATGLGKALDDLGQIAGGVSSGMQAGAIFGPIGSAIGGAIGGISSIISVFSKPEWKKAMEEVGHKWGVAISEGLAKSIEATETKDHVSRAMAELLHVSDIIAESGLDPSKFKAQIGDLMNAVALGAVPATEGLSELGKAFEELKTAAESGSSASEQAIAEFIHRAKELGETIPGVTQFVGDALNKAAAGLQKFLENLQGNATGKRGQSILSPEQNAANEQLFGALYQAESAQLGVVAASEALKASFDDIVKSLPKGAELSGPFAEAAHMMDLLNQEGFKKAAEGAQGLADVVKNLRLTDNLNQATVNATGTSAQTLYNQALAAQGATKTDALEAILPLLAELEKAKQAGAVLDPKSAELLAQAEADPVVSAMLPLADAAERSVKVQEQIRDGVYKLGGMEFPGVPQAASGAVFGGPSGGYLAELHGREAVVPLDNSSDAARVMADAGIGGDVWHITAPVTIPLGVMGGITDADLRKITRAIEDGHASGIRTAIQRAGAGKV